MDTNAGTDPVVEEFLAHYGVKGMKWGVRRALKKLPASERKAYLAAKDAKWLAKVEANPKLSKVSRKAARIAKKRSRELKVDYQRRGINIKKNSIFRVQYDNQLKQVLEHSLDVAAHKVHKYPPSRLNEVHIHRHPDGTIDAEVVTRKNLKITKQFASIAKADERQAKAAAKEAKAAAKHSEIEHAEEPLDDGDYSGLVFQLTVDEDGFVEDVILPEMEHSEFELSEDILQHYGIPGMKWGRRRSRAELDGDSSKKVSDDAENKKHVEARIKKGGSDALSNEELQRYVNRLNLEKQFRAATAEAPRKKPAKEFVTNLLVDIGKTEATRVAKGAAALQVEKVLGAKGHGDLVKRIQPKKK